jgi:hypothetical protein
VPPRPEIEPVDSRPRRRIAARDRRVDQPVAKLPRPGRPCATGQLAAQFQQGSATIAPTRPDRGQGEEGGGGEQCSQEGGDHLGLLSFLSANNVPFLFQQVKRKNSLFVLNVGRLGVLKDT